MKKLLTILILFILCSGNAVFAASPLGETKGKAVRKSRHYKKPRFSKRRKISKSAEIPAPNVSPVLQPITSDPAALPPAPVESNEESNYLSGNSVVSINTNSNAIIKIGLSPHGVVLLDFPVNDPVYEIHPADENFVTVGCQVREKTNNSNQLGRCLDSPNSSIVLRPGTAFNQWADGVDASTVVTIQRVSGLVVPIIIVPVKKITQNANYVAIRYDVNKVIESRQSSGLAFNLVNQEQFDARLLTSNAGMKLAPDGKILPISGDGDQSETDEFENLAVSPELLAALRRVGATKPALKFGKSVHGLALAVAARSNRLTENSIEVIAVKNTLNAPIRLTPEQPNLVIETIGEKNKGSVLTKDVDVMEIASNASDEDILNPGEIYYFAFSYKTPILGAKQSLFASFAHRAASDEPATILLGDAVK